MTGRNLDELAYVILPGKPSLGFKSIELYNAAFVYWKAFWGEILRDVGAPADALKADDFMRQDFITVLLVGAEIVGLHAYSLFDVRQQAPLEHTYFAKYFPESSLEKMLEGAPRSLMTMEYFSVSRAWRSAQAGVSLGAALAILGLRVAAVLDVDRIVTAARADVPAAAMAYELGAVPLAKDLEIFGKPTDIVCWRSELVSQSAYPEARALAERLWADRRDTTGRLGQPTNMRAA